jgi:hypothetical protein
MASGSSSAHSKKRRPGKSNSVTALAVAMPTTATPRATATQSASVVSAYCGNTVCAIWPNTSRAAASNWNHDAPSASTGSVSHRASRINKAGANQRSMGTGGVGRVKERWMMAWQPAAHGGGAIDPCQHKCEL